MVITAVSAIFIRDFTIPNIAGYTPIHLLVPFTLFGLLGAIVYMLRGDITNHRKTMQKVYIGACLVAGVFTLLPGRYLGQLLWHTGAGLGLSPPHPSSLFQGETTMLMQIIAQTPKWVFALFAALLWLGLSQAVTRAVGMRRITLMPLAMSGLSLYGTVSAFGAAPQVLLAWLMAASAVAWLVLQRPAPADASYDAATRVFTLPGSWVPLTLIMGIFLTKYIVGAAMSMQPGLAHNAGFALVVGSLNGAFSGMFAARAARLWRLVLRENRAALAQPA